MRAFKSNLLSTTVVSVFVGAGVASVGALISAGAGHAANPASEMGKPLPKAKPKPGTFRLAACNPCAAKKACNPCNPCAAKKAGNPCNPCNPCAAKKACNPCNPCNPCSASAGGASSKCFVPRLRAAWATNPCNPCNPCAAKKRACNPCNPCAAKKRACNPCNPCAAKKRACNPCNPCAAKKRACNPCNPCAAKKRACNPCNPCAAKKAGNPCNPCNPCGGASAAEITAAEATAVYNCLVPEMKRGYAKAGVRSVKGYTGWKRVNTRPYQSATHGNRYVNNYADSHGDYRYAKFEKAGKMPFGSVLAKDSFVVKPNGKVGAGPLFVMEKMEAGFNKASHDWRYTLIMPDGRVIGTTNGKGSANVKFCYECHALVAEDQDSMYFVPAEYRKK